MIFWIYHGLVIATLGVVTAFMCGNLLIFRTPRPVRSKPEGSVSILIPARNEALRIGPCLESLLQQDGFNGEIIVLNDRSEDDTAAIVKSLGFSEEANTRFRLMSGLPLPPGWTGKAWACHQLAGAAKGRWLLFTDADTVHANGGVAGAVQHAEKTGAALLSAWPAQTTLSLGEKLIIPMVYLLILGFLPQLILSLLQRHQTLAQNFPRRWTTALGAANGQHLLFRRESYDAIGGHEAVRNHMVEDLALGRLVAKYTADGMRLINCDGSKLLTCRMYTNFPEIWEGFTKNLRPAFDNSDALFFFSLFIQSTVFVVPFILLPIWPAGQPLLLMEIAWIYLLRVLPTIRFGTSWTSVLLHPFGHALAIAISLNSWKSWHGKGVKWKGRNYQG